MDVLDKGEYSASDVLGYLKMISSLKVVVQNSTTKTLNHDLQKFYLTIHSNNAHEYLNKINREKEVITPKKKEGLDILVMGMLRYVNSINQIDYQTARANILSLQPIYSGEMGKNFPEKKNDFIGIQLRTAEENGIKINISNISKEPKIEDCISMALKAASTEPKKAATSLLNYPSTKVGNFLQRELVKTINKIVG